MPTQSRKTILLATDQQRSVLNALDANSARANIYTAYGHYALNGLLSLLGFNGEPMDLMTRHYHLGNGYRPFSPVLMRFICPDSFPFSPFGKGGLNAYAYCAGDPVNRTDPSGHMFKISKARRSPSPHRKAPPVPSPISSPSRSMEDVIPGNKLVDIIKGEKDDLTLVYQRPSGEEYIKFSKKTKATETMLKIWKKDPSSKPTRRPVPKTSNDGLKTFNGPLDIDLRTPVVPGSERAIQNENALNQLSDDIRSLSK